MKRTGKHINDGFNSGGYKWCCENWGTKWGICNAEVVQEFLERISHIDYCFDTAWSPPLPVVLKMSEMFPGLRFILRYFECGCAFNGVYICEKGEVVEDLQAAYSGFLQVPSFLSITPAGHFAGVSAPCPTLSDARKSAIFDVVWQVLGSIGVSYEYGSKHYVKGNVRGEGPQRTDEENLSGTAKGIVLGVERNIVRETNGQRILPESLYILYWCIIHKK